MQEPIYNNGTVKVAKEGVSAYLAWYRTLSMADAKEISDVCSRLTKEAAKNAGVDLYDIGRNTFSFFGHQTEENWEKQRASVSEKMLQFFHFAEEFEQPIRAALWSKEAAFLYIGNPQKGIIVMEPEKYMTYTPDRDYSDLTPAQAMAELGSAAVCDMSIIPVGAGTALAEICHAAGRYRGLRQSQIRFQGLLQLWQGIKPTHGWKAACGQYEENPACSSQGRLGAASPGGSRGKRITACG